MNERIQSLLQWEAIGTVVAVSVFAWLLNALIRRRWSQSRHRLMSGEFRQLFVSILLSSVLTTGNALTHHHFLKHWLGTPLAFFALVGWIVASLRIARIYVFEWLFTNSAREGVPVLLVDLATLGASLLAGVTLLHKVFLIEVTSLVATSAVASVVLGLALQETLGHLFAGISLQFDRPFRLGDWIEVRTGSERVAGQVVEVSWRATSLMAMGEELVLVPNKLVATGVVLNYSGRERPFVRSYVFRIPLSASIDKAKRALLDAAHDTPGILAEPSPAAFLIETTESWIALKAVCFVSNYGTQFSVGDAFQTKALRLFSERGLELATAQLQLRSSK